MGVVTEKHNTEAKALMSLLDMQADCGIRESREHYFIAPEEEKQVSSMPPLSAILPAVDALLDSITEGDYGEVRGPYLMELNWIKNQLFDLHAGRYYEAECRKMKEMGCLWDRPRGVAKIETVGNRVRDAVRRLLMKMEQEAPGTPGEIRKRMDDLGL